MSMPTILDDVASLHAYNRWADGRLVAALRKLSAEDLTREPAPGWPSVRSTVFHIAGATAIWSRRLSGETVSKWPSEADYPTVDDLERYLAEGHDAFDRLIAGLTPEQLAAAWTYQNIQGKHATVPLWTVYRHVVNHATYHRGQAGSKLRLLGVEPPVTDLIYWAVEKTPQPQPPG
ncbi:MAG: DinB family protein [Isosphaeraceae bacterium]